MWNIIICMSQMGDTWATAMEKLKIFPSCVNEIADVD